MQAGPILQIAGAGFGALGSLAAGKAEKAQAERNAYIGRTRAIQTDTDARAGLNDELATMRATLAGNGQVGGAMEIMRALRETRGRERRVEFGNRMQEASDWRMQGKNAMSSARSAAFGHVLKGAPSLFDLYQLRKNPNG